MASRFYKKIYTIPEFYGILELGFRTLPSLARARKREILGKHFLERIMLAVTEVNGCAVCAWGHARMALEQGMDPEEISALLSGSAAAAPPEELPAILFSQHYADTKGHPSEESWNRLVTVYGKERSEGILGAARAMMIGNAVGLAFSAFLDRLKGKPTDKTSLVYEIGMMISVIPFLPVALLRSMLLGLIRAPIISFREQTAS